MLSPCYSFRDYWQITFVMLKQNSPPLLLTDNIEYQSKSNEEYIIILHFISSFEGTSCKNLYDKATISFYFLMFLLAFTSADMIFHNIRLTIFKIFIKYFTIFYNFILH